MPRVVASITGPTGVVTGRLVHCSGLAHPMAPTASPLTHRPSPGLLLPLPLLGIDTGRHSDPHCHAYLAYLAHHTTFVATEVHACMGQASPSTPVMSPFLPDLRPRPQPPTATLIISPSPSLQTTGPAGRHHPISSQLPATTPLVRPLRPPPAISRLMLLSSSRRQPTNKGAATSALRRTHGRWSTPPAGRLTLAGGVHPLDASRSRVSIDALLRMGCHRS